jgi:hypothetical protein
MKTAILSESPENEEVIRIIVDCLLGKATETIGLPNLQTRGWQGVRGSITAVLRSLHYSTDAEALIVVVDSDDSPVHHNSHDQPDGADLKCRLCYLRNEVGRIQSQLKPKAGRAQMKVALGLAVPAIEAWYRAGIDPQVTESAWIQGLQSRRQPYSRNDLKRAVYGTPRPSRHLEQQRGIEEARRLAQDLNLLEKLFPNGFGSLARSVRSW